MLERSASCGGKLESRRESAPFRLELAPFQTMNDALIVNKIDITVVPEGNETKPPELVGNIGKDPDNSDESLTDLPAGVHFAKLPKKKVRPPPLPARPPLAVVVGVASAGKSYLSLSILGRREFRAAFKAGAKTTEATLVTGKGMTIIDTPGLPDPFPASSDTYYDDTVRKLREVGYVNCLVFVVNSERITPTLIRNYGILYRAFNKLACVKIFVLRRETRFNALGLADQDKIVERGKETVNSIMEASKLKRWRARQFFILTNGRGDEQDKQVKQIREQVRISPVLLIDEKHGLKLTTEVMRSGDSESQKLAGREFEESLVQAPKWPGLMAPPGVDEAKERRESLAKRQKEVREMERKEKEGKEKERQLKAKQEAKENKVKEKERLAQAKQDAKDAKLRERHAEKERKSKEKRDKKKIRGDTKDTKRQENPRRDGSPGDGGSGGNGSDSRRDVTATAVPAVANVAPKGKSGCVVM